MPGPDYKLDAQEPPNQALGNSGESLSMCVAWHCPNRTLFASLSVTEQNRTCVWLAITVPGP